MLSNKIRIMTLVAALTLTGCSPQDMKPKQADSLSEARRGFKTVLRKEEGAIEAVKAAPADIFRTVKYPAPSGELWAFLSPNPSDGGKHPAIIWIVGGDCNSIGDVWSPQSRGNDQTAAAYRKAGLIMMFPSLRGGNDNPGVKEGFLGEVDDILAAERFLREQDYIDPKLIYLGGHSSGGTLALLVAECTDQFRAVFSFGPVFDITTYGDYPDLLPFDVSNRNEVVLRSPGYWLHSIRSPVWVFEGTEGNISSLRAMAQGSTNPKAHFIEIKTADHFATLAPTNELIAKEILQDSGEECNISLSVDEVNRNFTP